MNGKEKLNTQCPCLLYYTDLECVCKFCSCGLLGAVVIVQSNTSRKERPAEALLSVSCMGWEMFSIVDDSLATILSPTSCTDLRVHPQVELASRISLLSLFLSAMPLLQQTTLMQLQQGCPKPVLEGLCPACLMPGTQCAVLAVSDERQAIVRK